MKTITMTALILFLTATPLYVTAGELRQITIATHDYAPYYDTNGEGFLSDIYIEAFRVVGIKPVMKCFPISRGLLYFFDGEVDAHSPGNIFFSPDQMMRADCVQTFKIWATWFHYKPNLKSIDFKSLDSLKGYRLGVIIKSPYTPLYMKHGLNIQPVQTPLQLVKKTVAGRDDFFEATLLTGLLFVKIAYPDEWQNFGFITWDVSDGSLAFLKSNPQSQALKRQFEKGFNQIKANGRFVEIMEDYWGKGNIPKEMLPDDLQSFGTARFNAEQFQNYKRNAYGKIVGP